MLIYLDIDGVMIPASSWRKLEILEDGFPQFSSRATDALNKIITATNADIVLTTSHKHSFTLEGWIEIFKTRGVIVNNVSRLPQSINNLSRKQELLDWFTSENSLEKFIIIDDDKSLNGLPENLKNRLIQTSGSVGLTDYLADEAVGIVESISKK
ncbi:HAD domain-containing protein [Flavobacterium ardleyense]|uniref:HAD domain-containing protein n=1 Tax=Flavobacterium ardleyense TaxID=2038737 RepID=UPI00298D47D6|nr:HAD domain-containing protein [Flavobacterium ardleyense]